MTAWALRPARRAFLAGFLALVTLAGTQAARPSAVRADPNQLVVSVSPDKVEIRNALVARKWRDTTTGFRTTSFQDVRTNREWIGPAGSNEFTIRVGAVDVTSSDFSMTSAEQAPLPNGGVRVTMHLAGTPLFTVDQVVDAYPNVAGFRVQTIIRPTAVLVLSGYSLGEVTTSLGSALTPVGQTFHSGSDWRDEEDWAGPRLNIGAEGTPRGGRSDWRVQTTGPKGGPYTVTGNWIAARHDDGSSLFVVSERPNLPSSQVSLSGGRVAADANLARDVLSMGPIENEVHIENPTPVPLRHRLLRPIPFAFEPAFVGLSTSPDDEPWQHAKYLQAAGWNYRHDVTFNTNTIDDDSLPSNSRGGAKDSVDIVEFKKQLPVASEIGIETFILDDGWQLNSGDWEPDPTRFPNGLQEVRDLLADEGMGLGLWMSPLSFHPNSTAFRMHPTWACIPVGLATGLANATPIGEAALGGSAEAGIGVWNPNGPSQDGKMIKDLESKIARAITEYGSRYFKFDFLVWLDCVDQQPTDMYRYRETFVAMIDRLHARFPHVTFQIDETNDYRNWPFESVTRGPSWFQNGSPDPNVLLHNLWLTSPYVPSYSLGQAAIGGGKVAKFGVDYLMSAAMLSHMTFWLDLKTIAGPQHAATRQRIRFWTDLYKAHRDELGRTTVYPLLGDPMPGTNWTGLQPWNPDTQRGYLFAFRQDTDSATQSFALRGIRPGLHYRVTDLVTGADLGTFTSAQLQAGLSVTAPTDNSSRVLRIVRL